MSFGRRTWDREEYAKQALLRKQNKNKDSKIVKKSTISRENLDFGKDLNKRQIITGSILNTRGKSFGFYCDVCNLTFKDNLKFIDHLNSKPHLINSGEYNKHKRNVTLEEVKERYEMLCRKLDGIPEPEKKEDIEEKGVGKEKPDEMSQLMGFNGFGSTKK